MIYFFMLLNSISMPIYAQKNTTATDNVLLNFINDNTSHISEQISKDYSLMPEETLFMGVFFGIMILAIILNFLFAFILNDKSLWLFAGYLILLALFQLSVTKIGDCYIWPRNMYLKNNGVTIFYHAYSLICILFILQFLNFKNHYPKIIYIYYSIASIILSSLFMLFYSSSNKFIIPSFILILINFMLNGLNIITGIGLWKKGFKPARLFTLAFSILLTASIINGLKDINLIHSTFITEQINIFGYAIMVTLLSLATIEKFKQYRDQSIYQLEEVNKLKSEINSSLEQKVEERTAAINKQKAEIEEKNKEITDSINYSKRIQLSILPKQKKLRDIFKDHFVIYKPKDIVSGDFYWAIKGQRFDSEHPITIVAIVDCTGHGVPGAFMSILANTLLNQTINNPKVNTAADALTYLDKELTKNLNVYQNEDIIRDGVDIAMCIIDEQNNQLEFAGANNSIYILSGKDLQKIKGDKQAISGMDDAIKPFTNHKYNFKKGDIVYLFTDGYADQFGGPKGKKFKRRQLEKTLVEMSDLSMEEQGFILDSKFEEWRGSLDQVDDVTAIGIRL